MPSLYSRLHESTKGSGILSSSELGSINSDLTKRYGLADPIRIEKVYESDILSAPTPKNIEYSNKNSTFYVDLYTRASYYFFHCSILSTAILRIQQEALRNGIEWKPRFQCKCPRCNTEYQRSMRKCNQCGYEGEMRVPDVSQQKLAINYEGGSIIDKANRNGWSLLQLCRSFLIIALTYNQPVILCKSTYLVDEKLNVLDEFPQEFIPLSPAKCRMIYDETGTPNDGWGFHIDDRYQRIPMDSEEYLNTGYVDNKRVYPAFWVIAENDGGQTGQGQAYAEQEIFHTTFGLPSMTYGMPLCLLVEADIRAWMAMELRVEKYYSVGHPSGLFVINNTTNESLATVQQSIRVQMRDDPYTIPIIGIPPASDKVTNTKWHPLADNPTEQMMAVKAELQERICAIFGIQGLFLGDMNSLRGNTNEAHQVAIMDRNLISIREIVNEFLAFVKSKYKGITDWDLKLVEPPDNQALDEAEAFNKNLQNAKLAKDIGFDIISQANGKVEISETPRAYDPIKSLFSPTSGGASDQGIDMPQQAGDAYGTSKLSKSSTSTNDKESSSIRGTGNTGTDMRKGSIEVPLSLVKQRLEEHGVIINDN